MGVTGNQGIDVRQTGNRLIFRAFLQDSSGAVVTTGTTNVGLYEVQDDGTLKSYDWNDNTFKTTALTTEYQTATHQTGNNSTTNTGVWTKALTTLTGFTVGGIYLVQLRNTGAYPTIQTREFQYGNEQGDLVVSSARLQVDVKAVDGTTQGIAGFACIAIGTVTSGATTTSVPTSSCSPAGSVADQFKDRVLIFKNDTTTAALRGVAKAISASSNAAAPTFTVGTLPATPASGDTFVVV